MIKNDRSRIVNKTDLIKMLPLFYQTHLQQQLTRAQFIVFSLLLALIQQQKQVSLERLANAFPLCIKFESRRRKLQRFLILPQLTVVKIWFPLVTYWLKTYCPVSTVIYVAIDRTQWGCVNLMIVSLIWDKRAIPLYLIFLSKLGSSNLSEQKIALGPVFPLLKEYKTVGLGDREFCSVKLGNWLRQRCVYFCLRLKRDEFVQLEGEVWMRLDSVGLMPGISLYFQGVKVTKTPGIVGFNFACKLQKKDQGFVPKAGWFILTNLQDLQSTNAAYAKRFCIEEMFRDCQSGGYNLEATKVSESRLNIIILLIAIASTNAIIQGEGIKRMGGQKYVCRVKEAKRNERRHSTFYVGLYGKAWVDSVEHHAENVAELMRCSPNKRQYYQQGLRAVKLIRSAS